jgi:predicted phage tail protein
VLYAIRNAGQAIRAVCIAYPGVRKGCTEDKGEGVIGIKLETL